MLIITIVRIIEIKIIKVIIIIILIIIIIIIIIIMAALAEAQGMADAEALHKSLQALGGRALDLNENSAKLQHILPQNPVFVLGVEGLGV